MVRPALIVAVVALAAPARAASELPRRMGMYPPQGGGLAMVDSKIDVRVRGPIAEAIVTQTFRNDTDRVTEATYIFPLPLDAAVSAMEIQTGSRTIHAAIESREQAQQRYERAVTAGVGAGLLDQERPDVFTQTVSAIAAHGTVTVTLRVDSVAHYRSGTWELVLPMVVAPRYVPGTASGRPTTGTGRAPDTDRAPDASRVTPGGSPGAGGKTMVAIEFGDAVDAVTSPTHELATGHGSYSFVDAKSDHDAVIRWRAKLPATGWVEASDDGGFAAVVVEAPPPSARKGALRVQLLLDRAATTRGDADTVKRAVVRALLGALDSKDQIAVGGADKVDWRAPDQVQRALDASWAKATTPFDLARVIGQSRNDGALVLVSDGLVADDRGVVAAATKLGVPIHVIGIGPAPNRSLLAAIAATTGGTIRFAIAGDDLAMLAREVLADAAALPEPLKITWGTLQPTEVVPATLPRLGAGQATLVVAKVKRVQNANARVRNDVIGFVAVTPSRPPDGATTARGTLGRRWAKLRLDELVSAGTPRAITEHALRYGLVSPYTSMVAIGDEIVIEGGVKHSVPVAVSVPEGMHWQLVKREITVDKPPTTTTEPESPKAGGLARDERAHEKNAPKTEKKTATKSEPAKKAPIKRHEPEPFARAPQAPVGQAAPTSKAAPPSQAAPPRGPSRPVSPRPEPDREDEEQDNRRKLTKDELENIPQGGSTDAAPTTVAATGESSREADDLDIEAAPISHRARLRLSLSFGGGLQIVNRTAAPFGALTGRVEFGGRRLVGLEGALWLVESRVQGSVLASFTQRIARRLELGIGGGLRITSDKLGPAFDLTLRTPLVVRHLAGYLRYDGALLLHDQTYDGQNAASLGLEATW